MALPLQPSRSRPSLCQASGYINSLRPIEPEFNSPRNFGLDNL